MMLVMYDGPVDNLPGTGDAYAGYVNTSGIGPPTFPVLKAKYPDRPVLSITTTGLAADCADVEAGAMGSWAGYDYGYCAVSNVNALVARYGRPKRLWTAHTGIGPHVCSPACWPGLVTSADGTQWAQNVAPGYDESLLNPDFFLLDPPAPTPAPTKAVTMILAQSTTKSDDGTVPVGIQYILTGAGRVNVATTADSQALAAKLGPVVPLTGNTIAQFPQL